MSLDPMLRLLGIETGASEAELLGLGDEKPTPMAVDEALRRRLAQVYNHPDGRGDDAEQVRRRLREAAADLKSRLPRPAAQRRPPVRPAAPLVELTPFDRNVLAILIGSGGWNAISRARLVGYSAAHGITGQGLLKVIAGLGTYAKRSRFDMSRLRSREISATPHRSRPPEYMEIAEVTEEEQSRMAWRTVWLSLLFGLITCVLAILVVNELAPRPVRRVAEPAIAQIEPVLPVQNEEPAPEEDADEPEPYEFVDWGIRSFSEDDALTFHAPTPQEALEAAKACESAVEELEQLMIRLKVTGDERPAKQVFRTWEDLIHQTSTAWLLLEESHVLAIERMMFEVLFASAARSETATQERLLGSFDPPAADIGAEPLDLWRGAWRAGMLARIGFHPDLPASIVNHAQAQLNVALERRAGDDERLSFTQAAASWLDRAEPVLFESLASEDRAYSIWEHWISVQKRLGTRERVNAAMLTGIHVILADEDVVARVAEKPGPALAVLGRLLEEADFKESPAVRERLLSILDDEEEIGPQAVWLLTNLLAHAVHVEWFDRSFVLRTSDSGVRARLRRDIAAAWPSENMARGLGSVMNREELDDEAAASIERWHRLLDRNAQESIDMSRGALQLQQVVRTAKVGEAAAFLMARTPSRAERLMDEVDAAPEDLAPEQPGRSRRTGHPTGTEGGWGTAYEESRRDAQERTRLLRALRASAGGDLWPSEAAIVVREAYRGSPNEIRSIAQGVILDAFRRGPNVARQLLDQLPDVHRTPALSDFLERYTTRPLPTQRDHEWMIAARLAIIDHILSLLHGHAPAIEQFADDLGVSYANVLSAVSGGDPHEVPDAVAPEAEAAAIFDWWRQRAQTHAASRLGEELAAIDRRQAARMRLAEGPIQETVAWRIGTLELMAIDTRGEVAAQSGGSSGLDEHLSQIIERYAKEWRSAPGALLQALWVERAINAVWRVRLPRADDVAVRPVASPVRSAKSGSANRDDLNRFAVHLSRFVTFPHAIELRADERWSSRLEALDPERPLGYFELAEEVADEDRTPRSIALARHLFALAGALDPDSLGRSACLALADLEGSAPIKRKYIALAELLGRRNSITPSVQPSGFDVGEQNPEQRAIALAVVEAFSHYRQGNGTRAAQTLRREDVAAMLDTVEAALPSRSAAAFRDAAAALQNAPAMTDAMLIRMLQIERFLLGEGARGSEGWAMELTFTGGRPLIEVNPDRLDQALEVDVTRPYYREGQWVARP